ncbi:MAG: HPr family phosphocarrier protein [Pseudobdellovibrionaceae bacterium]|uniref:HPr family phosphocarrier protein n=1 Tax=Oligoflexus sp. TaxID=1971216 RepID=UPI0027C5D989|nr:HPr family phosphocarrier protein [Oligoflexus sp.]MDQ3230361.1 HPr family phosphocarrier protein [Pseudobdellovibrionaceae bacterium]HYX38888.1 HPr family phosphocarrier protein [Oligoflexus sp.]
MNSLCRTVKLQAQDGLHTRPAALFVQEAKRFSSEIVIEAGGRVSSAKSLFKLQLLELQQGADVTIKAEGEDAHQAVEHLSAYLDKLR